MSTKTLTPTQSYAKAAVDALDALIASEHTVEYSPKRLARLLLSRPQTLRCALSVYLYRSRMQSMSRK